MEFECTASRFPPVAGPAPALDETAAALKRLWTEPA